MKFTLSWLKKFLDTKASLAQITNALSSVGFEVEEVIDRTQALQGFEVAYIKNTSPHPSAERLKICQVETTNETLQIVCGAPNARAGLKVVLAKIGTVIPNGNFKIKESEIRGVRSYGMLCSEEELLIGTDNSGIIELDSRAIIGEQFVTHGGLDDPIIHIEVTPNRPDALGVYGIARDLAAKNIGTLKTLTIPTIDNNFDSNFSSEIEDKSKCSLFAIREIKNLSNKASPNWLQRMLNAIGVRPISAIVDITNYISYSFGQPIHAYDRNKLDSKLKVKSLLSNTPFTALNDKEYLLQAGDLVIEDNSDIQCLAGIIGSRHSSCSAETSSIILESACFDSVQITKSGRTHNIITDSRYRFERKVDSSFTITALDIASEMIISICGGESSQIIFQGSSNKEPVTIEFSTEFLAKYIGIEIPNDEVCNILEKLGFQYKYNNKTISITVPLWRPDIEIKQDIVEEIMRIYGYDKLPEIPFNHSNIQRILTKEYRRYSDIRRILANQSYDEIISWSFIDVNIAKNFSSIKDDLVICNPISVDLNYMRPSIVPGLLKIVSKNFARSIRDINIFEVGPVFTGVDPQDEHQYVSAIRTGNDTSKHTHSPKARPLDVYDIKADLAMLLSYVGLDIDKCRFSKSRFDYYHPTRSLDVYLGKNQIASFGEMHPAISRKFDINQSVFAFELNLSNLPYAKNKFGQRDIFAPSDFQSVTRDFAFIVNNSCNVGDIINSIKNLDKKFIKNVELFDVYQGDKIPANTKSVALSISIQAQDRTLTDEDLKILSQSIISDVKTKFDGSLRDS